MQNNTYSVDVEFLKIRLEEKIDSTVISVCKIYGSVGATTSTTK